MPKASSDRLILTKAAVARCAEDERCCLVRLRVEHNKKNNYGFITIWHRQCIATFGQDTCSPTLRINPQTTEECKMTLQSNDIIVPRKILKFMPDSSVANASDVVTLALTLTSPGIVLCPAESANLTPANQHDEQFIAFASLCKALTIHIHIGKTQLVGDEITELQAFAAAMSLDMKDVAIDHKRLGGGKGVRETTWQVFEPPPYSDTRPPTAMQTGKRFGRPSPNSPDTAVSKRARLCTPPPGSPTEPNTPSTRDTGRLSTIHMQSIDVHDSLDSLAPEAILLANMLKQVPVQTLRAALHHAGLPFLLPSPANVDLDKHNIRRASFGPVTYEEEGHITAQLQRSLETQLQSLVHDNLEALVRTRLEALVDQKLPSLVKNTLEKCTDQHVDTVQQQCDVALMSVEETAEDCFADLKRTVEEGIAQLERAAEQLINELSVEAQGVHDDAADLLQKIDAKCDVERQEVRVSTRSHHFRHSSC